MTDLSDNRDDVPDVSVTGINQTAKMVWTTVRESDTFKRNAKKGRLQGLPGMFWRGAVNQVINELWPSLNDRYLIDRDSSEEIKLLINRYLRQNRALVCTQDGGYVKKSIWFVADHWPELVVTPGLKPSKVDREDVDATIDAAGKSDSAPSPVAVTPLDVFALNRDNFATTTSSRAEKDTENTEERSDDVAKKVIIKEDKTEPSHKASKNDNKLVIECRFDGCSDVFSGHHHRAVHELSHGIRVNADGTVTTFDPSEPSPAEDVIAKMLIDVAKENSESPLTQEQLVEEIRKRKPRASASNVRLVLQILVDDKIFGISTEPISGSKAHTRRHVLRTDKKPSKVEIDAPAEIHDKRDESDRLNSYRNLFNDFLVDLDELERLRADLKALKVNLEALKIEHQKTLKKLDDVTEELHNALKNGSQKLQSELDHVTEERNELQGRLDTLKKVFGSALQ